MKNIGQPWDFILRSISTSKFLGEKKSARKSFMRIFPLKKTQQIIYM